MLLILGSNENMKISGIEVIKAKELQLNDIGTEGRLIALTEKAVKDLEGRIYGNKVETKEEKGAKK